MDALSDVIYLHVQRGELEVRDLGRLVSVTRALTSSVAGLILTRTAILRYQIDVVGKRCEAFEKDCQAFRNFPLQKLQHLHANDYWTFKTRVYIERLERLGKRVDRVKANLERLSKQAEQGGPLERGFSALEGYLTANESKRFTRCATRCGAIGAVKRCNERFRAWAYREWQKKLMVLGKIVKKIEKDRICALWIYSSEEVLHYRGY